MKTIAIFFTIIGIISCLQTANAMEQLKIEGKQAKHIYQSLTGPAVQQEGAAGHLYRKGKSILCRYTDVDMSDGKGKSVPMHDPRRYACSITLNHNGMASPGRNP